MAKFKPKSVSRYGLPKTGQTVSYQDYDDGYFQKGYPLAGARFVDNGDNTIVDRATGLQWIKRPELIIPDGLNGNNIGIERGDWVSGTPYAAGDIVTDSSDNSAWICLIANSHEAVDFATERTNNPTYWQQSIWATSNYGGGVNPVYMVWSDAINNSLITHGGKSDYRLPNIKELMSIADYGRYSPAIDTDFFPNCQSDYYWSSTTYAADTDYAWVVGFDDGLVSYDVKYSHYFVRPVRQY